MTTNTMSSTAENVLGFDAYGKCESIMNRFAVIMIDSSEIDSTAIRIAFSKGRTSWFSTKKAVVTNATAYCRCPSPPLIAPISTKISPLRASVTDSQNHVSGRKPLVVKKKARRALDASPSITARCDTTTENIDSSGAPRPYRHSSITAADRYT